MCKAIITAGRLRYSAAGIGRQDDKSTSGLPIPAKRARGLRLILAIDQYRVVRGRAAEPVPRRRIGNVGIGTGIDEDRFALEPN